MHLLNGIEITFKKSKSKVKVKVKVKTTVKVKVKVTATATTKVLLGRPKCFSGREDEWHDWSPKLGAIAATLSDHASVWMSGALKHTTEIALDQPDEASERIFARQMYTFLIHLCQGRALAIVRGAPDHNGLEAWRLLHEWYQPKTRSSGLALLNEVLAAYEGLGECDAGIQQNCKCATTGRGTGGCVDFRAYLHVQVREEMAKLGYVRQLLSDYLRAGKAWKADTTAKAKVNNQSNSDTLTGIATIVASTDTRNQIVQARAISSMARVTTVDHMDTRELTE